MVMVIDWGIMGFMPLSMEIVSVFKGWTTRLRGSFGVRETLRVVLGLCFSFGRTIKGV